MPELTREMPWKIIVAQSSIIGEAIGILHGLGWRDEIPIETRKMIGQCAVELERKYRLCDESGNLVAVEDVLNLLR